MLTRLFINNFAVIDNVEISFREGLTVLTGETGAGKSILVDALGLALGGRADAAVIRTGCERAEISAEFNIKGNEALLRLLREQSIPVEEDGLTLRRVVNAAAPSRAYVNATAAPAQLLRQAGACLVDIYGQHAHQSLLKRAEQRELLDDFGDYGAVLEQARQAFARWDEATRELGRLTRGGEEFEAQAALLRYQVEELDGLELQEDEPERLEAEHRQLANADRLLEVTQAALHDLYAGDQSLNDRLSAMKRELASLGKLDAGLANVGELLENATIQVAEAAAELRAYLEGLEQDPARLRQVEQRLELLQDAARKHRAPPGQLHQRHRELRQKLEELESARERAAELGQAQEAALAEYREAAARLGEQRRQGAAAMAAQVVKIIRSLGMPQAEFLVTVETDADAPPREKGDDQVEFLIAANPGQAPQPLRKVASGGELSRIGLAVQVSVNRDRALEAMIFDEIDAGIGGGVAEIVGRLLHGLAAGRQVFCVTHLPQVASQGDHHFQVVKVSDGRATETRVVALADAERVEEIARMAGGVTISERSREHAREMLGQGDAGADAGADDA